VNVPGNFASLIREYLQSSLLISVQSNPLTTPYRIPAFLFEFVAYVVHAEANAILNKNAASVKGARLYVGLFPCNECAKLIIQSGIIEVVYASDKYKASVPFIASRKLLALAGVKTRQHSTKLLRLTLTAPDDADTAAGAGGDAARAQGDCN
jgi:tRNA(Arg) A34 adenosine deaminase TadA